MTIYHDTCTFCVHNENPNKLGEKKCKFKDCGWQKEHFESVSEEEKAKIDQKLKEDERAKFLWNLSDKIVVGYSVIVVGLAIISTFLGLSFRFSHPELTETQLILELWKHYWGLDLALVGMIILPFLFKK